MDEIKENLSESEGISDIEELSDSNIGQDTASENEKTDGYDCESDLEQIAEADSDLKNADSMNGVDSDRTPKPNYPYVNAAAGAKIPILTRLIKRTFDFCSSLVLFIFLCCTLIFPILTVLVALKMKGNPFFVQRRPGKNGKIFPLIKFRTMTEEKDESGDYLPDEMRMTKFGAKLRETSLDELPELLNIIAGQMSVVGPRPQLVRDMVFFSKDAMVRQSVRPGLTGLAQISGRNNLTWEERLDRDIEYIGKIGFFNDLRIIFKTVGKVLKTEDVATDGMETSEDYGDYLLRIGAIDRDTYDAKQSEARELLNNGRKRKYN